MLKTRCLFTASHVSQAWLQFLNSRPIEDLLTMEATPIEKTSEAIDEVLAWSNLFKHHMRLEDVLRNLRIRSSTQDLLQAIESTSHLSIENNIVFSEKYLRNSTFEHANKLAQKHLEDTKGVLAILSSCQQVTGLAVTGSVAAGMNGEDGDVDVMIITKPGWVWRVRALAIYISHKHPDGGLLCPNMVMSEESLQFDRSMYTAREMMQIIPLKDYGGISQLYRMNTWVHDVLPNADKKPLMELAANKDYPWWWKIMNIPIIGSVIESWEARRRMKELKVSSKSEEAIYSKSVCRGHENSHKVRIETEYTNALGDLS